jgi:pimeloyl-ACP methyl ester carboxylesterase
VFVHGAVLDNRSWRLQVRHLRRSYRPLALDLPGHGATGEAQPSVEYYAQAVVRFIDQQHATRPVLVGHSMGGAIVLTLALADPGAYRGLVLAGSGARLRVLPALIEQARTDFSTALNVLEDAEWSSTANKKLRQASGKISRQLGSHALWCDLTACDQFDVTARLSELTLPALAIVGAEDRLTPVKFSQYLSQHMPDCRLAIIPSTGHMAMLEQPDAFNAALGEFLSLIS